MATTDFTNGVTLSDAGWADDVDCSAYSVLSSVSGTNTVTATGPATYTYAATRPPVWLIPAATNTGATTINVTPSGGVALGAKNVFFNGAACAGGELIIGIPTALIYDGTQFHVVSRAEDRFPRGHIAGGTLSNNSGDATNDIDIAAGEARNSTNVIDIRWSALTKRLDATFAAGTNQGMLDTGSIGDDVYHIFAIRKDSDGSGDILASTSATAPQMPSGYTYFRRIGAIIRATSIRAFSQFGDEFLLSASVRDVNTTPSTTDAVLSTMTVPDGVKVIWIGAMWNTGGATTNSQLYVSSPDQSDEAPSVSDVPGFTNQSYNVGNVAFGNRLQIRTNSSAQIRSRLTSNNAAIGVVAITYGWIDRRGRDS